MDQQDKPQGEANNLQPNDCSNHQLAYSYALRSRLQARIGGLRATISGVGHQDIYQPRRSVFFGKRKTESIYLGIIT